MTTLRISAAAALLALACGSPAAATDCTLVSGNALADAGCGFADGIAGWTANESTQISWHEGDGEPAPGALALRGEESRHLAVQGPCFALEPSTSYELVGHFKSAGEKTGSCSIAVTAFSDEACSADEDFLGGVLLTAIVKLWESTTTDTVETDEGARAARLAVECYGGPGLSILLDNVVMTPE